MTENRPELVYELLLDGNEWADISQYVAMGDSDSVSITRGRQNEGTTVEPSTCTLTLNNKDGRFSPRNPLGAYYGIIGRNTPLRVRTPDAPSVMHLTRQGDEASTPDASALDITGAIDIRASFKLDKLDGTACIVGKGTAGGVGIDLSYQLLLGLNGAGVPHLTFRYSPNGTSIAGLGHDMPWLAIGQRYAVRATFNPSVGGNIAFAFYTSDDGTLAGNWVQDGATQTFAGTTSIHAGAAQLVVGHNGAFDQFFGDIYGVEIRNGIGGTVVANPDFSSQPQGTTFFTDSSSRVWTLANFATVSISNDGNRFIGEMSAWPQQGENTGDDAWTTVQAAGILRRIGQGQGAKQGGLSTYTTVTTKAKDIWPGDTPTDIQSGASFSFSKCAPNVHFGQGVMGDGFPAGMLIDTTNLVPGDFTPISGFLDGAVTAAIGCTTGNAVGFVFKADDLGALDIYIRSYLYWPGGHVIDFDPNTGIISVVRAVFDPDTGWTKTAVLGALSGDVFTDGQIHSCLLTMVPGAGLVTLNLYIDGVLLGTASDTVLSTLGGIPNVMISYNPGTDPRPVAISYLSVWSGLYGSALPAPGTWAQVADGYIGETAGRRIQRLCNDNDIPFSWIGDLDDTTPMGPQGTGDLVSLLQDAANTDLGILYEPRDRIGLAYRTRTSLYNQDAAVSFDYSAGELATAPQSTDDDQQVRNDVTASRQGGGSAQAVLEDGPLSVNAPPEGIGTYSTSVTVNVETDGLLPDQAAWRLATGAVDEARYPSLPVSLMNPGVAGKVDAVRATELGDVWQITDLPTWLAFDPVRQLVQGYTETISMTGWDVQANMSPASPYTIAVYADPANPQDGDSRYDSESSFVDVDCTSTATTLLVGPDNHTVPWTTNAADFPFDINVGGERMTVTNITGTSSQTFTVVRSVNGVVKGHTTGDSVRLWNTPRYGL